MYTKAVVYPYKLGSESARALAQELVTKCVKEKGRYQHRPRHLVVNWGNSRVPNWQTTLSAQQTLNKVPNVMVASDKVSAFQRLLDKGFTSHLPEWTRSQAVATEWFAKPIYGENKLNAVVCRALTHANSGRGITLATKPEEMVAAPLYTRYKPKQFEYRLHISSRYGVIDEQQKRRKVGSEEGNKYIRSHRHGWIFCREDVQIPAQVRDVSIEALAALGLDFGAVDVGYHPQIGITIYEVNTAPGLEGQTLTKYVNMINQYLHG